MKKIPFVIFTFFFVGFLFAENLKVAAVQLKIDQNTYSSYENFKKEMEEHVRTAVETFNPDLIIFPEYTSVFPAVTPYYKLIADSSSVEQIFYKIHDQYSHINTLKDIFTEESERVEELLLFWGVLSNKYSVTILGGTYFALEGETLRNRLIVYGPEGNRIYQQDKFFLTDFETDIINLSPGSSIKPRGITINDKDIVFTICRDTFLDRWESMYEGADLWIDIKANGEFFTDEQRDLFARALPARLKKTDVNYGVTVCLTGRFLELFWEGESSMVKRMGDEIHPFVKSRDFTTDEILYFVVD